MKKRKQVLIKNSRWFGVEKNVYGLISRTSLHAS